MRNFQQKRGWEDIMQSWPVLIFLGILVCIFAYGVFGLMLKMQTTRENRQIIENKVTELQKEKDKLAADTSKLSSVEGKEESIREKFGLAKEGEGLIVVVDDKSAVTVPKDESKGFWGFMTSWFK